MSRVRADRLTNRAGTGAPTFPNGAVITGVATATSFAGNITGTTGTFSGNVSVGGTLTYEDVTNIDSVGIVTARTGIKVLAGGINIVGVTTAVSGVDLNGTLREKVNVTAGKLSDNLNIDLANGMVHLFQTNETGSAIPNIRVDGSTELNNVMVDGESVVVTLITQANSAGYCPNLTINGGANRAINWVGGSAPSDGSSGVDIHTFTIIKTASDTFTIIGNQTKTA
jgi:hypothetical protein